MGEVWGVGASERFCIQLDLSQGPMHKHDNRYFLNSYFSENKTLKRKQMRLILKA